MKAQALQYVGNELSFAGRSTPFSQLLGHYHRPIYFYDLKLIQKRAEQFTTTLPGVRAHYAMKANTNPKILKTMKDQGLHVDVVSGGEIKHALSCGFEPRDVIFSGVGKTKQEIRYALELGIHQINIESLQEMDRISKIAKQLGKKAPVSLRVNPDIDIGTHPYIATGLRENKFGLELAAISEAAAILEHHRESLELVGVSFHLGSQMTDTSPLRKAFRDLKPVFSSLRSQFSTVKRLDFGGGLGIHYQENQGSEEHILKNYAQLVIEESASFGADLQCEPGRWLVAHAGVYITQVQYIKVTSHKHFLITDGGMNHLIRPSLYNAYHEVYPVVLHSGRPQHQYDIVGPICESSDFLAKGRTMQEMKSEEFLAVADAGAYGAVMASHYNMHELPLEICLD